MSHIFQIDKTIIKAVDDETARELVARLCRAELRSQGLPESAVTWGGDQRAKDGGVDVRVDCQSPLIKPDFVTTSSAVFQVKAEKFPPGKIAKEMAPKGAVRPAILDLKDTGGSYVIVSTHDDASYEALQPRRDAIARCLTDHGLDEYVQHDFYDSRRMADWVEQHPSVATWLRHKAGCPLKAWRPYGPWAYAEEDAESEYLVDELVRVFSPGAEEGSSVTEAIAHIRRELQRTVSIRFVGLSGIGKTRFVQALFDQRVCPDAVAPPSDNVIYVDLADEPKPRPQEMLESLLDQAADAVVVIDNCSAAAHERLTGIVKRSGSRLRLITVEYDIREDVPEETSCYRLEGASPEIIKQLLKSRFQHLSDADSDRIAVFSDGNARVAYALASTAETKGELARLQNRELFERLFLQKHDPNDELLRCAEAASLLYSFDSEDVSSAGEVVRLATFAEVTPMTFRRQMAELKRRGLLQERGRWRAVLPHAISNELARRMLESVPAELLLNSLVDEGGERVTRSFSRRLGFLHDSPQAVALASQMLAVDGRLGTLSGLTDFEKQMVANLAPLDQKSALDAIGRAAKDEQFLSTHNPDRARFARLARSIAYEPEFFDEAVAVLKQFELAEPKDHKNDSIREMLKSLFYCHLSGTQASPTQRHQFVAALVSSDSERDRSLGFELLGAGLEAWHFSSHYGFEFGARHRDYGWHPRSQGEAQDWFRPWVDLVASVGICDDEDSARARTLLGEAWRGLWGRVGLDDELVSVARRFSAVDGWPEGWLGIRRVLHFDGESLSPISLAQLKALERELVPSDLISEIRARVLARGSFLYDLDDEEILEGKEESPVPPSEKYRRARMNAETLGKKAARSPGLVETLIAELCSQRGGSGVYEFGRGVGAHHADVAALLRSVRDHVEQTDGSSLSLTWASGVVAGWQSVAPDEVSQFLDDAVGDPVWKEWFVALQLQASVDKEAFDRLLQALEPGGCPSWQFSNLAMGRATDPLTVSQIATIAKKLAARPDRGLVVAIDLLAMVINCADEKDEQYKSELGQALQAYLNGIDWSLLRTGHDQDQHDLNVVLEFALQRAEGDAPARSMLERMLPPDEVDIISFDDARRNALKPFFKHFPRLALDFVCVPDSGGALRRAQQLVSDPYSGRREGALSAVPRELLIKWCDENPALRYPFAAGVCELFEKGSTDESATGFSETALALFTRAPDKQAVLAEFLRRFHPGTWSGSLADILEARLLLLDQLAAGDDGAFADDIETAKGWLRREIDRERTREQDEERARTSSFE